MLISAKLRYAVMVMSYLANGKEFYPIKLSEIASNQSVPWKYSEQVMADLRRSGLVSATKGPGGGYSLNDLPQSIKLAQILEGVKEEIKITRCNNDGKWCTNDQTMCLTHSLWDNLGKYIQNYFDNTSLVDVLSDKSAYKISNSNLSSSEYIYADYNATAPVSDNVKKSVFEALSKQTLNPSSLHRMGQEARKILQDTRDDVRNFIGVPSDKEIVFTSSATEANNFVMKGIKGYQHVISAIEHSSVLNSACNSHIIPVNQDGVVNLVELEKILSELKRNKRPLAEPVYDEKFLGEVQTSTTEYSDVFEERRQALTKKLPSEIELCKRSKVLVSVMMANNETGVIQPIRQIAEMAHKFGAICHTDAAQSVGKVKVNMKDLGVDLLTLSAHKFGGIAGSGVLIFDKKLEIEPIISGGGQEKGLRGGTENIVAIAGLSAALKNIPNLLLKMSKVKELRDQLECELSSLANDIKIFGKNSKRLPNTSFICMPGVKSDVQLMHFDLNNIGVSNGSACSSGKIEPSHVLFAMKATKEQAECSIRISIGPETKFEDIKKVINCWYDIYKKFK